MDDSRIMSSEDVIHIRDLVEDNSTTLMLAEIVGSWTRILASYACLSKIQRWWRRETGQLLFIDPSWSEQQSCQTKWERT